MLKDKNILVGVSGGIAVYKVVDVVSKLRKLGANVNVIMTKSATQFVSPLTFQTLSQNLVHVDMFEKPQNWEVKHISLAEKADLVLIAPATANVIGKVANGIADDMLSTTIMATKSKVVFAPAMNTNMYKNIIVQTNINKLKKLNYKFIKPGTGKLACGTCGEGRLTEPDEIVKFVVDEFTSKKLINKKIVITAGPTIEPLDPVRYMTNFSSGKMGYFISMEAKRRGADVVLITGPVQIEEPKGIKVVNINTTRDMLNAIEKEFDDSDVLIKSAAPLDYRPEFVSKQKIKKNNDTLEVKFVRNPDVAAHFGKIKNKQIIVGFAAETQNVLENAKAKLRKKNFDFIVANDVSKEGAGFGTETNIVSIIDKDENIIEYPLMSKEKLAKIILDKVQDLLN